MRLRFFIFSVMLITFGVLAYHLILSVLHSEEKAVDSIIASKEFIWANFSQEERNWLSTNNIVQIGIDKNFYPVEGLDESGSYTGIASDYLRIFEKIAGVQFEIAAAGEWSEVTDIMREGNLDMLAALAPTSLRKEYLNFTSPYIQLPGIIVVRSGGQDNLTLNDLAGKHVAVVYRYAWHDYLEEYYPEIIIDLVENSLEGLQRVAFGQSDAMVDFQFSITRKIEQSGILNLKAGGATSINSGIAMGVRKNLPELRSIMEKALQSITPEEHSAIARKWVNLQKNSLLTAQETAVLAAVLICFIAATCFTVLLNLSLKKLVARQTSALNQELVERDKAENALRKSEERYRKIFENIQDVYLQVSPQGIILEISPSVWQVFGYDRKKVHAANIKRFLDWHVIKKMSAALHADGKLEDYVFVLQTDSGPKHCSVTGKMQYDAHGRPLEFFGSVRNITTRVRYEQMLAKINQELEARVVERTLDLQQMNKELQISKEKADAATEAKSRFLASISHEIRTPLHSIIAFTKQMCALESHPDTQKNTQKIMESSRLLLGIINELLDFSKIEAGLISLEKVSFIPEESISTVWHLTAERAAEQQITLFMDIPIDLPALCFGDAGKLQQIFLNLISNALKFTMPGGEVIVSLRVRPVRKTHVILQCFVQDTGIGIPEDSMEQIFTSFQQIQPVYGGTGLGLSICKQFAERMGGEIWAESTFGQGSTFAFSVPIKMQQAALPLPMENVPGTMHLVTGSQRLLALLEYHAACAGLLTSHSTTLQEALDKFGKDQLTAEFLCVGYDIVHSKKLEQAQLKKLCAYAPALLLCYNEVLQPAANLQLCTEIPTAAVLQRFAAERSGLTSLPAKPLPSSSAFQLPKSCMGLRLLIAEDTRTNCEVLSMLLAPRKALLTFVHDGLSAVEAAKTDDFDLILMDIQMPVLNGYEAAAQIQDLQNQKTPPIIALTAHALESSRHKAIKSGMHFFLPKPFGQEELYKVMEEALSFAKSGQKHNPAEVSDITDPKAGNIQQQNDVLLRLGTTAEGLGLLAQTFLLEHRHTPQSMKENLADKNYNILGRTAHNLGGAAANLGLAELADLAGQIETLAKSTRLNKKNQSKLAELVLYLEKNLHTLEKKHPLTAQAVDNTSATTGWDVLPLEAQALLQKLHSELRLGNPIVVEQLLAELSNCLPADIYQGLHLLVMEYQYEEAEKLIARYQTNVCQYLGEICSKSHLS